MSLSLTGTGSIGPIDVGATAISRPTCGRLQSQYTKANRQKSTIAAPTPIPTPASTESLELLRSLPVLVLTGPGFSVLVLVLVLVLSSVGNAVVYMDPAKEVVTATIDATGKSTIMFPPMEVSQQSVSPVF